LTFLRLQKGNGVQNSQQIPGLFPENSALFLAENHLQVNESEWFIKHQPGKIKKISSLAHNFCKSANQW
jgi:hypothetical protein